MENKIGGNKLIFVDKILEKANLREGMKIADLGCGGNGYFLYRPSMLLGESGLVWAVDVQKSVVEEIKKTVATENYKNIKAIRSNLEKYKATKIESMSLDLAFLVNVLHQNQKKLDLLRESIRMLKKEGRLIIVDWEQTASPIGPNKEQKVNKDNLIKAMEKLGMLLEEEFVAGKYHFGLVYKKL